MDELIKKLAEARKNANDLGEAATKAAMALDETQEYKLYQDSKTSVSAARLEVAQLEKQVRDEAISRYVVGENRPHPAITIKIFNVFKYEAGKALDYAREHLPNCVNLDTRAFEKAAPALGLDFVTVEQEPRAQIASDLSEFVV